MTERLLVTGAGGFLGSHICQYLGQRGYVIAAVGRFSASSATADLYPNLWKLCGMTLPDNAFIKAVVEFQPTLLVHCAGTASIADSVADPYGDFQRTVDVCAFTLEALRKHAPQCQFVLLSSAAVYGNPVTLPVAETAPVAPLSPYGYHKLVCEALAEEYRRLHGISVVVLRVFSAYGERLRRQVIFDLCRKFADSRETSVEVYGTGEETRDFIHAQDVARAIALIHQVGADGVFNVASGEQTRVREIVELVQSHFPIRQTVYSGRTRPGDPLWWQADISKLTALGFRQQISLKEGVSACCGWFKSVYGKQLTS